MTTVAAEKTGHAYVDQLEEIRAEYRSQFPRNSKRRTREEGAAGKRRSLLGGSFNHTFAGEQYLNCPVKSVRRMQLQKLMDENGQTNWGGRVIDHPTLARWEAKGYGLTDAEIRELEKADYTPDELIHRGWRTWMCRHENFAVAIGTSYVGEGETYLRMHNHRAEVQAELDELRAQFTSWGVENVDEAVANAVEHALADEDHGLFNQNVIREHVNTPELKEEMRKAFILRAHSYMGLF